MLHLPIETERLRIRRFEPSDSLPFLEFMLDQASTRYLMFEARQKTEPGARELFESVCSAYDSPAPIHAYAIATKDSNRYLGSCGYSPYDDGIVECYYSINRSEWGRGFATEALIALASQLATQVEVRAYCHPDNVAAHAVARKAGFVDQGLDRHRHFGHEGRLFVCQSEASRLF
ncbi:GNAT family N-acetyltransferase [Halomicronema hongdechloris]|uniref:GNAT family N-acetyltransferase n=1 Tax=Halomicronema hongdechloris TaxID=1209493 RepID=UPI0009B98758